MNDTVLFRSSMHKSVFILALCVTILNFLLVGIPYIALLLVTQNFQIALSVFTGPSLWIIWPALVLALVPSFCIWLLCWWSYTHSHVIVTTDKLKLNTGLVFHQSGELYLQQVDCVMVWYGLFGHYLNYGTVVVTSISGTKFIIPYMLNPNNLRNLLTSKLKTSN